MLAYFALHFCCPLFYVFRNSRVFLFGVGVFGVTEYSLYPSLAQLDILNLNNNNKITHTCLPAPTHTVLLYTSSYTCSTTPIPTAPRWHISCQGYNLLNGNSMHGDTEKTSLPVTYMKNIMHHIL